MQAVTEEIGADRVGIRISPVSPVNDSSESQPQPLFEYVVRELNKIKPVYIHVVKAPPVALAITRPSTTRPCVACMTAFGC